MMKRKTARQTLRRMAAAAAAVIMGLTLAGCKGSEKTTGTRPDTSGSSEYPTTVELSWMIPTQQNMPLAQSAAMQAIMQKFNVNISFTELGTGSQQFDEKKRLLIASKKLPDVMTQVTYDEANEYGPQGAFLEIGTVLDQMPNLKKYFDEEPGGKYQAYSVDDRLFFIPAVSPANTPIFGFGYNATAAKAVGFDKEPQTWDEFYQMLKALKAANPESYPLTFRGQSLPTLMFRSLFAMSFTEGKINLYNEHLPGYDYDSQTYINGVDVPGYRDAVEFMNKLYTEELIDPEFMSLSYDEMINRLKEEKSYVLMDYSGGLTGEEVANEAMGGKIVPMNTPSVAGKRTVWGYRWNVISNSGTVLNASLQNDPEKLERILAIIDYMYSQEFYDLLYNHPDVKTGDGGYIDAWYTDTTIRDKYLPWSLMANFQVNYKTTIRPGTPYADYEAAMVEALSTDKFVPTVTLPSSEEMAREENAIALPLKDYFDSSIDNFIIGKTPMSQWDAFAAQMREKGGEKLAEIYNDRLNTYLK